MPQPTRRTDQALDLLGILAPVTVLLTVAGYARQRARSAWRDDRGLSETAQTMIWVGIAVAAALSVGGIIVVALRNRSTDIGNDIEDEPLP